MQQIDLSYGAPSFDVLPALLARLKDSLKLSSNSFDAKLTLYIKQSIELIGRYTNRILVESKVTGRFTGTSRTMITCYPALYFPVAPVYRDAFVSASWSVDTDEALEGFVTPFQDQGYVFLTTEPTADSYQQFKTSFCACDCNGIKEIYPFKAVIKAGYGQDVSHVWLCPKGLQQAIISLSTHFYDNPSDCGGCASGASANGVMLPYQVAALANPYRIRRVF